MTFEPRPEHRFSFGLWTVGNIGRDPFGEPVREVLSPPQLVELLAEVGAWGVNLHDNDLVPIDATPAERDRIVTRLQAGAATQHGLVVPMATSNLFYDPVFRDGAFTANDPRVRAYALQKTMRAMDLGAELGAKIFVLWGGREGTETDACRRPDEAVKRLRDAVELPVRVRRSTRGTASGSRSRPSRTSRAATSTWRRPAPISASSRRSTHPEMVGVNPEVAHEHDGRAELPARRRAGVGSGQAVPHRPERSGARAATTRTSASASANLKAAFFLVKFLEDVGYDGPRHFDAHAYRTEDYDGVRDFARGCMRTYLILKEKAERWNADPEIQALVAQINADDGTVTPHLGPYTRERAEGLKGLDLDRRAVAARGQPYERLDQLTVDLLLGAR